MSFLHNFFGTGQRPTLAGARTGLDLVTSTAALASNPAQIDPILDSVRTMTAQVDPGQKLQATDEAKLMDVYLRLEQYLTTQEPIRSFTKEELRARIAPDLLQRLAAHENKR